MFLAVGFHWILVNYCFLFFKFSTWKYVHRSCLVSEVRGLIKNRGRTAATFRKRIFHFDSSSCFLHLDYFFFFQEMASCSLTDAGIWCWSSQDAGDPTTTRSLTLRQLLIHLSYFSLLDVIPPLDVFPLPFVFIFLYRMSLLYNLRMRRGLLLFLFTQVILVASFFQTGRWWLVVWIHVAWQQAAWLNHWSILHHFAPLLPLTCYTSAFPVRPRLQGFKLDHVNTVFTIITLIDEKNLGYYTKYTNIWQHQKVHKVPYNHYKLNIECHRHTRSPRVKISSL